jgi:hypothetical protein
MLAEGGKGLGGKSPAGAKLWVEASVVHPSGLTLSFGEGMCVA